MNSSLHPNFSAFSPVSKWKVSHYLCVGERRMFFIVMLWWCMMGKYFKWCSIDNLFVMSILHKYLPIQDNIIRTRVASHLARSGTPRITCVVACLFRSDPNHIIMTPLRPMARLRVCRSLTQIVSRRSSSNCAPCKV